MLTEAAAAKLQAAVPVFLVDDVAATLRWYERALGFRVRGVPERPPHAFGIMARDDVTIFLQQLEGHREPDLYERREGGVWSVYLQTNDVRALYDALRALPDVTVLEPLGHRDYGQTEFVVRDPNGYVLAFAQAD